MWLGEALKLFQNRNMIMSGLNIEKLLMLMYFQRVMIQWVIFRMYTPVRKFPMENAVNLQTG